MKITLTKLDTAKRQLEIAIRLYFSNEDPVEHTLSAAAYNIIKDLNKKSCGKSMFFKEDLINIHIKPEFQAMVKKKLNEAENYFKHADKDHERTFSFNPKQTESLIFEGCSVYSRLSTEDPMFFKIFRYWFVLNNPNWFLLETQLQESLKSFSQEISKGREYFFKSILPIVSQIK